MSRSPTTLQKVHAWFALSRPPFHTVGVLPFVLGSILAWRLTGTFRWDILAWGTAGVVLVMLSTYYAGEYWDQREDAMSTALGHSSFAGGSRVLQTGVLPGRSAFWGSIVALVLAIGVALVLQLGYRTGPLTLPFCILGLLGGFFYSTKPVRWVSTGLGEIWIAFCYGWLPIAVGYYLQVGEISCLVHWLAIPVGLTILNVILLNEFPDYPADSAAGKANLTVRLGRKQASLLYAVFSVGSWIGMPLSVYLGVPILALAFYMPVFVLSVSLVILILREKWRDRASLERLCGANLLVNLGTTAAYILAFVS